MRIEQRPTNRLRATLHGAAALLLALLAGLTAAAQGHAAAQWQAVPPPAPAGLSAYIPFDATSAVARSTVQTSTTCLPCEYEHTLWTRQAGAWRSLPLPGAGASTAVLTGTAPNDVWALGRGEWGDFGQYHWDGSRWTDRTLPDFEVLEARAVSRTDVWAVGNYRESDGDVPGAVAHGNGSAWTLTKLGAPDAWTNIKAVHVVSAHDVWVVGSGGGRLYAAHYDGASWQEVALPRLSGLSATANAVTVRDGEVWIGGTDRNIYTDSGMPGAYVLRGNGTDWQTTYVLVAHPGGGGRNRLGPQGLHCPRDHPKGHAAPSRRAPEAEAEGPGVRRAGPQGPVRNCTSSLFTVSGSSR